MRIRIRPAHALSALFTLCLLPLAGAEPSLSHDPANGSGGGKEPTAKASATDDDHEDDGTVVTATRFAEDPFELPVSAEVVSSEKLKGRAYRTTPQALRDIPGVMVQETAYGQGSPFIRGFTGFRNVFLIDGIRLNNSVFRDGPNQYWNTIDPLSLDRLEITKGPSSVLYGSDAIGGTVNAITKNPYSYGPGGTGTNGTLYYRVSSAEESHVGRGELSAAFGDSFGLLVGGTGKHLGDFQAGSDLGTQPNTGYNEWDADVKAEQFLDEDTRLVFAYQQVKQNDVPRTHRTVFSESFEGTTIGSDLRRDLDQDRQLAYVQLHGENVDSFFDSYGVSLSWHNQEEMRDRIRGSGAQSFQGFDVGTLGFFAHLRSNTPWGRFVYGFDYYRDDVSSFSSSNPVQGPVADDATYDLLGVFVRDEISINDRLDLTLGGRFNYAAADANSVLDPVSGTPFSIDESWSSFVGSAHFLYRLVEDTVNLFGGVSQGFRAPNLSDLTRFDSARTNEFEIPSPDLDAERYLTYEVGVKTEQDDLSTQVAFFYTDIEEQILRFPTGNVNMSGEFEITKDNVGYGFVYGIEAGAAYRVQPQWTLFGNSTFMEGKVNTFPTSAPTTSEEYIDRLMPLTTQLGVRWDAKEEDKWAELVAVHTTDADKLSTRDANDTGRIPPGGTPGYLVLHLRGGWQITDGVTLNLGLENLTDEDYRVHGSGQNMPGVNFLFGLTAAL